MPVKLILSAAMAAVSVVASVVAAQSFSRAAGTERRVGDYNKALAERDAKIHEQKARQILHLGKLDQADNMREFGRLQDSTRMALSNNGWMASSGTPALQLAYNAEQAAEQERRNDYALRTGAAGALEEGVQARLRGTLEQATAHSRASALQSQGYQSLLGGASRVAAIAFG